MNVDFEYIPNPDYDANKTIEENKCFPDMIDPLCAASKMFCSEINLPLLEQGYKAHQFKISEKDALFAGLHQIARHQIAPPEWLAELIIKHIATVEPRVNGLNISDAEKAFLSRKTEENENTPDIAKNIIKNTSSSYDINAQATLSAKKRKNDRLVELWEDYEPRLSKLLDKLP